MPKIQTSFKNPHKASFLAKDIAQYHNRGTAIEQKIETVLNQLRECTDMNKLTQITQEKIQAYVETLQDKLEQGELKQSTAATYISALNDIIRYTTENTKNTELTTISAQEHALSRGSYDIKNRAVPEQTHQAFKSYLAQQDSIQAKALAHSTELQREFGLRLRESLQIQQKTIEKAIKTGNLHLTRSDGTKNGRTRDIQIRTETQKQALEKALSFMKANNLKSLAPTDTIKEQYKYAENVKMEFNKMKNSMDYHGERHFFAQNLHENLKQQEGLTEQEAKKITSEELGHNRAYITNIYLS